MQQILIEAHPNSSRNEVEKISDLVYKVYMMAPAKEGKANAQLIKLLTDYFNIAKSRVEIKAGKTAKTKVVIIYG